MLSSFPCTDRSGFFLGVPKLILFNTSVGGFCALSDVFFVGVTKATKDCLAASATLFIMLSFLPEGARTFTFELLALVTVEDILRISDNETSLDVSVVTSGCFGGNVDTDSGSGSVPGSACVDSNDVAIGSTPSAVSCAFSVGSEGDVSWGVDDFSSAGSSGVGWASPCDSAEVAKVCECSDVGGVACVSDPTGDCI